MTECITFGVITNIVNQIIYDIAMKTINNEMWMYSEFINEKKEEISIYNAILNYMINKIDMKVDYFLNDKWNKFDTDNCYKNFGLLNNNKPIKLSFH